MSPLVESEKSVSLPQDRKAVTVNCIFVTKMLLGGVRGDRDREVIDS